MFALYPSLMTLKNKDIRKRKNLVGRYKDNILSVDFKNHFMFIDMHLHCPWCVVLDQI